MTINDVQNQSTYRARSRVREFNRAESDFSAKVRISAFFAILALCA